MGSPKLVRSDLSPLLVRKFLLKTPLECKFVGNFIVERSASWRRALGEQIPAVSEGASASMLQGQDPQRCSGALVSGALMTPEHGERALASAA